MNLVIKIAGLVVTITTVCFLIGCLTLMQGLGYRIEYNK